MAAPTAASADTRYEAAVRQIWRHTGAPPTQKTALQRELVRYATLAASSHNTQCWKFRLEGDRISILPDLERRTPVVDPDDHHLYASLGCATENLLQAALAHGLQGLVEVQTDGSIQIDLEPTQAIATPLFNAIPQRQSTRADYDGQTLSTGELAQLEQAAAGNGVNLLLLTEKPAMEQVLAYVIEGSNAQTSDPDFVQELKSWIRFSEREAVRRGDGLFARCSGNPTIPRWLGNLLFDQLLTPKAEAQKCTHHIRSSAGIAIFVADHDRPADWINAGRAYQRFALQATAMGVRTAFLNQPVEVATLRPQFAQYLGVSDRRPDLVVRFGRGPEMPRSLRRPVAAVLV
ncbi:nitroreductase family protein [Nodosilinea sp. LEGE 07088]|uniref:Acg family FMN-binding oxidoreductase n=1 Tax=Nodosilinea sp. LEGE 07088 TaxID=2777968 RepID=UPI0028BD1A69|nr:nitroreductase family protein [Nodosilinea sp. LEGE 07088]